MRRLLAGHVFSGQSFAPGATAATYETALPANPVDGQEIYYAADATNGVIWHLRYRSGSSSSYKWEFVGGSPLWSEITTAETTTSTTYTDLATAGPSITTPLAGDYVLRFTVNMDGAGGGVTIASPKIGSAATSDSDRLAQNNATTTATVGAQSVKTGLAASTVIKMQYRVVTSGTASIAFRRFQITPIRGG